MVGRPGLRCAQAGPRDIYGSQDETVSRLQRRNFRVNGPVSGFVVTASLPTSGAAESLCRRPVSRC